MPAPPSRRPRWSLPVFVLLAALVAGCAHFPDSSPRNWRDKPENGGPLATPPQVPDRAPDKNQAPGEPPGPGTPAVPNGCDDPDPVVVATCLDPASAIAVLPGGQAALVAERATGRILRVEKEKQPELIATVPVDPAGGGLSGLVLSPSYGEDHLLYAYAATAGDHRVLRIAGDGQPPMPILTGIPRPAGNDGGALGVSKDGYLLVVTAADGSSPAPTSLGGKLLRIDTFGRPARDNPTPGSPIYSSGLRSPGGICTRPDTGTIWVTDRAGDRDTLHKIAPGPLGPPAWSWPERPGVAGCATPAGSIVVAERGASALYLLRTTRTDSFTGTPQVLLPRVYGRLGPTTLAPDNLVWAGTVNKRGGGPVTPSDDRVLRLLILEAGSDGSGPD